MAGLQLTIGYVFLGIFVLSALIALADAIGWLEIRREWQRKALWTSAVASPIGAIALLGQSVLKPEEPPVTLPTEAPSNIPNTPVVGPAEAPSETDPPVSEPSEPIAVTPDEEPAAPQADPLLAWAENALEPRPFLDQPIGGTYPDCAKQARARGHGKVSKTDAANCFALVDSYNTRILIPYINRQGPYIADLDARAKIERNRDRANFMQNEYASFTAGAEYVAFESMSHVYSCDKWLMINLRDYGLFRERRDCPARTPAASAEND